jgi:hypothetical protein
MADKDINWVLRARDAASGPIGRVGKSLHGLHGATGLAGRGLLNVGGAFVNLAKKAAAASLIVIAAAAGLAVKSVQAFEEQERAIALVNAAYGKSGAAVRKWAEGNAINLGVNDDALETSLAAWGVYARGIGLTTDEAAKAGQDLATRAAQIAASTGKSYEEVFGKLVKGVEGATRGLKTYGVAVDNTVIRNEALRLGLIHGNEALDLNAKAIATQSLILKQTTPYVDAFGKAQAQASFKSKQMGVVLNETMESIGQAILPVAVIVMPALLAGVRAVSTFITTKLIPGVQGWLKANAPLIKQVASFVNGALSSLYHFIVDNVIPALAGSGGKKGIIPTLVDFGKTIFSYVIPKVAALIDTFVKPGGVVDSVRKVVDPILNKLIPAFASIITSLFGGAGAKGKKGLIPALGDLIGVLWGNGKGPLALAVIGIGGLLGGLVITIDKIIGGITWAIVQITKLLSALNTWKAEGGDIKSLPFIPFLQHGGPVRRGGSYIVGEAGPELFSPSSNGTIIPNKALVGGGGDVINFTYAPAYSSASPSEAQDFARRILPELVREMRRAGAI